MEKKTNIKKSKREGVRERGSYGNRKEREALLTHWQHPAWANNGIGLHAYAFVALARLALIKLLETLAANGSLQKRRNKSMKKDKYYIPSDKRLLG
jgi:hypothetical protein